MWIFSQHCDKIVNSNQTSSFFASFEAHGYDELSLYADDILIGTFRTHDDAKKELKHIYDALIAGQVAYSVD